MAPSFPLFPLSFFPRPLRHSSFPISHLTSSSTSSQQPVKRSLSTTVRRPALPRSVRPRERLVARTPSPLRTETNGFERGLALPIYHFPPAHSPRPSSWRPPSSKQRGTHRTLARLLCCFNTDHYHPPDKERARGLFGRKKRWLTDRERKRRPGSLQFRSFFRGCSVFFFFVWFTFFPLST